VNLKTVRFWTAGKDGVPGNSDDLPVSPVSLHYETSSLALYCDFDRSLPYGVLQFSVETNILDLTARPLRRTYTNTFENDLVFWEDARWRYRIDSGLGSAGFEKGPEPPGFREGQAAFGSGGSDTCLINSTVWTTWPRGTDSFSYALLRRTVEVPPGLSSVNVLVAIRGGVEVWWDGVPLSNGVEYSSGCAIRPSRTSNAFGGLILNIPPEARIPGQHLLAVRAQDFDSTTYVDVRVTATSAAP
jgi:hypothetical protein